MLDITVEHQQLLSEPHRAEVRVSAFKGGAITEQVVPITSDGNLRWNGDQQVQCTGTLKLAKDADSLVPKSRGDALAPYGQEVRVERVDFKGSKEFVTPLGQFRITELPSMREFFKRYPSRTQMVGWSAELSIADRFEMLQPDEFLYADSPPADATVWGELQRLSPLPIEQPNTLPDVPVPSSLTAYPDNRLDAITALFDVLGAYPHLTRYGVLTGRPKDVWLTATEPVFTIRGTIDLDDSMSNKLYNAVKVSSSAGSNDLFAVLEITDPGNPVNVADMGRRVFKQASPLYATQEAVNAAAVTILARVSSRQSRVAKVTCLPQPHLELGDYIRAQETTRDPVSGEEVVVREVDGEITTIDMSLNPTASWTYGLIVAETR